MNELLTGIIESMVPEMAAGVINDTTMELGGSKLPSNATFTESYSFVIPLCATMGAVCVVLMVLIAVCIWLEYTHEIADDPLAAEGKKKKRRKRKGDEEEEAEGDGDAAVGRGGSLHNIGSEGEDAERDGATLKRGGSSVRGSRRDLQTSQHRYSSAQSNALYDMDPAFYKKSSATAPSFRVPPSASAGPANNPNHRNPNPYAGGSHAPQMYPNNNNNNNSNNSRRGSSVVAGANGSYTNANPFAAPSTFAPPPFAGGMNASSSAVMRRRVSVTSGGKSQSPNLSFSSPPTIIAPQRHEDWQHQQQQQQQYQQCPPGFDTLASKDHQHFSWSGTGMQAPTKGAGVPTSMTGPSTMFDVNTLGKSTQPPSHNYPGSPGGHADTQLPPRFQTQQQPGGNGLANAVQQQQPYADPQKQPQQMWRQQPTPQQAPPPAAAARGTGAEDTVPAAPRSGSRNGPGPTNSGDGPQGRRRGSSSNRNGADAVVSVIPVDPYGATANPAPMDEKKESEPQQQPSTPQAGTSRRAPRPGSHMPGRGADEEEMGVFQAVPDQLTTHGDAYGASYGVGGPEIDATTAAATAPVVTLDSYGYPIMEDNLSQDPYSY